MSRQRLKNMVPLASLFLFVAISLLSVSKAQDRAPHGLSHESPMAFSPSAYQFFNPKTQQPSTTNLCDESNCSPLPLAATVESSLAHESRSIPEKSGGSKVGAGGVAGIIFGFVFAVLLAMGVYYVVTARRANLSRNNLVQPDV